ncbi:molybdate ABC transporter ATP-binding protein ModF [Aestuariirhabdus sp. Z084]|uniref:molybdate ABC transporter ATP-binding protein ModF n=1 Tax=Aestuariirhabdus haliotis TaxID=2918751 RepID=UPI00201B409D|nr:molybdate ABC transporter ATP-binding protein ModF [Aestuariirhabdus haliotis]MCL6416931.1 molybdate ABC transporter ATP-binding protein ModF [Aestuariirhabdus haliotis]MCL6420907.1 molybdate ABC transporter ATP-binding protein ModF [Aestuariirhabdus haliotis]
MPPYIYRTTLSMKLSNITHPLTKTLSLSIEQWSLKPGEQWALVGSNGSGKSLIGQLISGDLTPGEGTICERPANIGYVSFEKQQELLEAERYNDDTDFMDKVDTGTPVRDLVQQEEQDEARLQALSKVLGMTDILDRGFRLLSTGETRKLLLARALMSQPDMLVLDEPFDGLDAATHKAVEQMISNLMQDGVMVVLLLNRFSELLPEITHVAYVQHCTLLACGPRQALLAEGALQTLHQFHQLPDTLPVGDSTQKLNPSPTDQPLVKMKNIRVSYAEKTIIDGLSWQVDAGQHWAVRGPNGCGKTTLLSLVSGDHPQSYANDICLFGLQRGSGESIWEIKQHIGLVSSSLQLNYRVPISALNMIISGFFDTIGVYNKPSDRQKSLAMEWLHLIHLEHHANTPIAQLSYGQQRMLLIARAMVKHPPLLILDEPCQGLDEINRQMVLALLDQIGQLGESTLLFVSHHEEDYPNCIANRLEFVAQPTGGFAYRQIE